ncbi:MAG: peptide chain release factor 2 [Candidatus Omnitrophota bacterium]
MLEELKEALTDIEKGLAQLGRYLDADKKQARVLELESAMSQEKFWDEKERANKVIAELKDLKSLLSPLLSCRQKYHDIKELTSIVEPSDTASLEGLKKDIDSLNREIKDIEFMVLMSGPEDKNNAILSINSGAGGTESCDWVSMLLRMYTRWAQRRDYKLRILDYLPGEEAGVKNITMLIEGMYAFGYLKTESGVHRLVRISPFDSNKRRHTSFASVDVIPEISDEIKVDIQEKDLRIDVYRATGPGGQSVNTTDSAVRITHLPTGIVVQCQNERSQYKNKQFALKILRARLHEREREAREEKLAKEYGQKMEIAWGSQIRSYVFHPYTMVKDHRTEVETGKGDQVMDGDLDIFIEAYLKHKGVTNAK